MVVACKMRLEQVPALRAGGTVSREGIFKFSKAETRHPSAVDSTHAKK